MNRVSGLASRLLSLTSVAALVASAAAAVGIVAIAPSASADPGPIAQRSSTGVTADALPTAQIDGVVWSQAVVGNTVYAGGSFANARPAGSPAGQNQVARSNLLSYNLTTGVLNSSFNPSLNAQIKAVTASPDGSRIYVGGYFTTANGSNRYRIAAYSTATGSLIATFAPSLNAAVNAIVATNTVVYVGGIFTTANGVARSRLAAFNASDGGLLGWAPSADDIVDALVMTPDGSRLIAGGSFQNVNGSSAYGLAALDSTTGVLYPWAANTVVRDAGASAAILSLSTDGKAIYSTAYVYGDTGNFEGVMSAAPDSGTINWLADCHGDTYGAYGVNDVVYTVSHMHFCSNIGGFPDTNPRNSWHRSTAFTANATGTVLHNGEGGTGYGDFYGQPSPSLINWFPDLDTGTYTGQDQGPWTVAGNSQYVVEGGEFLHVNGTAQQGLVRFAIPSIAPNKQGPMVTGGNFKPTVVALSSTSVRVSWPANWDRDDQSLSYKVTRNGNTGSPVYTTTATSQFWNRPTLGFHDTGLTPGATYGYRLYAIDPSGNQAAGDTVTFTMPTSSQPPSPYSQKVVADGASPYWPMDETSGSSFYDQVGYNDATATAGITRGAPGPISGDTATTFDGQSDGSASTATAFPAPNTFTEEAWVRTTSTSGGKFLGFGDQQTGTSGSYDRHLYLDNNGLVWFGVYNNQTSTLNSTTPINDGQWHQVVASLGPSGMALYVDGSPVAKRADVTVGQQYNGYWRIGGDNLSGWPSQPASNFLAGDIGQVAIFPTVLSRSAVQAEYVASGRSGTTQHPPTDPYGSAVYNADPDLYWRLGETSGTTVTDSGAYNNPGDYVGGVTLGVPGAIAGTSDTAASFDGSSGFAVSRNAVSNPTVYSEEGWFKTTTTSGGKIIGFGDQRTGTSNNYDRHIYMQDNGQLVFGTYTGQTNTITTSNAYNDGQWHYVAATQGPDGMSLYVDGALAGTNPQTAAQSYTGYWRVGGDTTWGSSSPYFGGTIDDVAVYSTELSASQVANHYSLGNSANQAPVAAFTPSCTNLSCSFDGSGSRDPDGTVASYAWDFGDGSTGSGVSPSHAYAGAGSYSVKLTVTDNQGATNAVSKTVTVAAANQPPVAAFTPTCTNLSCSFDGSGSRDPDGTVASYAWDFGDGGSDTVAKPSHSYAAAGTYPVKLTVTDNNGATNSVTHSVTVATGQPQVLASDSFTRSLSGKWGSADTGGVWAQNSPNLSSVNGSAGIMNLNAPGAGPTAYLNEVSAANVNELLDTSVNAQATGNGVFATLIARHSTSSDYRLKLRFLPTGVLHLAVSKIVNNKETTLKEVGVSGITYNAGDVFKLRFQVSGSGTTALSGKVWKVGSTEPASSQMSMTDTESILQGAGSVGVQSYIAGNATNAPILATFDNYSVTAS